MVNQGLLNVLGEVSAYVASQAAIEETPISLVACRLVRVYSLIMTLSLSTRFCSYGFYSWVKFSLLILVRRDLDSVYNCELSWPIWVYSLGKI